MEGQVVYALRRRRIFGDNIYVNSVLDLAARFCRDTKTAHHYEFLILYIRDQQYVPGYVASFGFGGGSKITPKSLPGVVTIGHFPRIEGGVIQETTCRFRVDDRLVDQDVLDGDIKRDVISEDEVKKEREKREMLKPDGDYQYFILGDTVSTDVPRDFSKVMRGEDYRGNAHFQSGVFTEGIYQVYAKNCQKYANQLVDHVLQRNGYPRNHAEEWLSYEKFKDELEKRRTG